MILHAHEDVYVLCVCIVGHGYTTIPKTLKIVLDISLFNTQQYKTRIKDKLEQSRERSSALPNTSE